MRVTTLLSLALPLLPFTVPTLDSSRSEQPTDSAAIQQRREPRIRRRDDLPAGGAIEGTVFNGRNVPPATEIPGHKLEDTIAKGNWLVEFFSPDCGHCKHFAPTWQTLYEFYYTDDPVPQAEGNDEDMSSFTRYYDFHFAKVNCLAFGDACARMKIGNFPTIQLFKDGEVVKKEIGGQTMSAMSKWVEETLETIKPGSRVKEGMKLPKAGDHTVARPARLIPEPLDIVPKDVAGTKTKASTKATSTATRIKQSSLETAANIPLTAEKFQKYVTMTHDPWFVKFYAPWCHHCQEMAPNWQNMARQMKGKLNVGEVNCDEEKRLCRDVKVKGFPTILFFRGGERIEYDGLRGLGDLVSYATKTIAVGEGVPNVTATEFEELEKKEEVIFLYFYDAATTSEDFAALDRLVMSLIGHAKLVKTSDPDLATRFKISTWPRLLVSRDGKPSYYIGLSPQEMRDFRKVLNWMQTVWLPIVPELTAINAREVMNNRLVVLGILSRDRPEEFVIAKREIKNAALEWIDKQTSAFQLERQELRDAKQLRIEEAEDRNDQRALRSAKSIRINMDDVPRKEVGFAWVDGVFWERWLRTTYGISIRDGERVVINDEANKRYWDTTMTGNPIVSSRTSILETLRGVVANPPKIGSKSTTTPLGHVWWVIRGGLLTHPIISSVAFVAVVIAMGAWGRRRYLRNSGGYIKLSEKSSMDGLLGGNAGSGTVGQGKVD
nr:hypothetical protein B0A51_13463 [Rachicladosporium sp. CCFEE 5018]